MYPSFAYAAVSHFDESDLRKLQFMVNVFTFNVFAAQTTNGYEWRGMERSRFRKNEWHLTHCPLLYDCIYQYSCNCKYMVSRLERFYPSKNIYDWHSECDLVRGICVDDLLHYHMLRKRGEISSVGSTTAETLSQKDFLSLQIIIDCVEFNKFAVELQSSVRADSDWHLTTCHRTYPCNCRMYIRCPDRYFLGDRKTWVAIRMNDERVFWHDESGCQLVKQIYGCVEKVENNCSGCRSFHKHIERKLFYKPFKVDETTLNRLTEHPPKKTQFECYRSKLQDIATRIRSSVRLVKFSNGWHFSDCYLTYCGNRFHWSKNRTCRCLFTIKCCSLHFIEAEKELVRIKMGKHEIWHNYHSCGLVDRLCTSSNERFGKMEDDFVSRKAGVRCSGCKEFKSRNREKR